MFCFGVTVFSFFFIVSVFKDFFSYVFGRGIEAEILKISLSDALIAGVVVFFSTHIHEFGHWLVFWRYKIPAVIQIDLWARVAQVKPIFGMGKLSHSRRCLVYLAGPLGDLITLGTLATLFWLTDANVWLVVITAIVFINFTCALNVGDGSDAERLLSLLNWSDFPRTYIQTVWILIGLTLMLLVVQLVVFREVILFLILLTIGADFVVRSRQLTKIENKQEYLKNELGCSEVSGLDTQQKRGWQLAYLAVGVMNLLIVLPLPWSRLF